jgi:hypothetical protein
MVFSGWFWQNVLISQGYSGAERVYQANSRAGFPGWLPRWIDARGAAHAERRGRIGAGGRIKPVAGGVRGWVFEARLKLAFAPGGMKGPREATAFMNPGGGLKIGAF